MRSLACGIPGPFQQDRRLESSRDGQRFRTPALRYLHCDPRAQPALHPDTCAASADAGQSRSGGTARIDITAILQAAGAALRSAETRPPHVRLAAGAVAADECFPGD